jgi:hypothetical protein
MTDKYSEKSSDFTKNESELLPDEAKIHQAIEAEINLLSQYSQSFFSIKTGAQWLQEASLRQIPNKLYRELWYEGELGICFADTNVGKSILAVQIAADISKDQKALYFDFELTDKQFESRYSDNYTNHYPFHSNFLRAEINTDGDLPEAFTNFEDYLNHSLEQAVIETESKVLIIDNITYLRNETERAKDALPLMKHLKALKKKFGLSILCLAHTPKRDQSKPITRNDLQGSKMLINFCDSAFAIGESFTDKSLRYIKQIKQRNCEHVYDSENVILCRIEKPCNFLGFSFVGFSREFEHLKQQTERDRQELIKSAKDLAASGKSQRQIATELNISVGSVNNYLNL